MAIVRPFSPPGCAILRRELREATGIGGDGELGRPAGIKHLQRVPDVKLSSESLMVAVKNIARRLGDDISESKPILDSRLPDGSRVAAVLPLAAFMG
jgi:hypothetical protein